MGILGLGILGERPVVVLHLNAGNDRNGNPRRLFVALGSGGQVLGVEDEGYSGHSAAEARWPGVAITRFRLDTTPSEYKRFLAMHKKGA